VYGNVCKWVYMIVCVYVCVYVNMYVNVYVACPCLGLDTVVIHHDQLNRALCV